MSTKDYILIAKAIREVYDQTECYGAIREVVYKLCEVLKADNPNFKPDVFILETLGWKAAKP